MPFEQDIIHIFLPAVLVRAITPIGNGNINDTKRVDYIESGAKKSLILQCLNHAVFKQPEQVMHNLRCVNAQLRKQSAYPYRVIEALVAPNGRDLVQDEAGNYWRAFPFVEDIYTPEGKVGPAVAFEAACAFGRFAAAFRDFPSSSLYETIPGFHDTDQRWAVFEKILQQKENKQRQQTAQAEIAQLLDLKPVFEQISRLKNEGSLPLRVTHNDTKAGNILMHQSTHKAVAVIDLDTVMPGTVLSDFGDMVRTFVPNLYEDDANIHDLYLQKEVLSALREGYLAGAAELLTALETAHLMLGSLWICGEQALRFGTDYLAGDVYYKTRYPEHNLVRTKNQLALCAAIQQTVHLR